MAVSFLIICNAPSLSLLLQAHRLSFIPLFIPCDPHWPPCCCLNTPKHAPTAGPLHLPFPVLKTLASLPGIQWLFFSFFLDLCLNINPSKRSSLIISHTIAISTPYQYSSCLYFLALIFLHGTCHHLTYSLPSPTGCNSRRTRTF